MSSKDCVANFAVCSVSRLKGWRGIRLALFWEHRKDNKTAFMWSCSRHFEESGRPTGLSSCLILSRVGCCFNLQVHGDWNSMVQNILLVTLFIRTHLLPFIFDQRLQTSQLLVLHRFSLKAHISFWWLKNLCLAAPEKVGLSLDSSPDALYFLHVKIGF